MNAIKRSILVCSVFCLNLSPLISQAVQPENPVACVEGSTVSIGFGDHTTNCELENPTDRDRFQFNASSGDTVRVIVLSGTNSFDPVVEVRGPNGSTIVGTSFCSGNIPGRLPFRCSFSLDIEIPSDGDYEVGIADSGNNESGTYILQLEMLPPISIAFGLPYDSSIFDSVTPQTDIDFFEFEAAADTDIRLIVLSETNGFDPTIEVRDSNGQKIDVEPSFCSGNIPGRLPFRCSFSVDITPSISGKHTLALYDSGFNEEGNYEINLQCLFGDCPDDEIPPPPASLPGDIDLDGDVDRDDLDLLLAVRNTSAVGDDDKRDLDGDGKITAKDARILTTLCTNSRCATQ